MSAISYRDWDMYVNRLFYDKGETHSGYFECIILQTLMSQQTVEFIAENFYLQSGNIYPEQNPPANLGVVQNRMLTNDGQICIKSYEGLDTQQNPWEIIKGILERIHALSLCVDFPLVCTKIRFTSHHNGLLLSASRHPIGRGVCFEVEERQIAREKVLADLSGYSSDTYQAVGEKHYLAGMTLMGLEDQVEGLIDAAFMQFYQGCEILCRDSRGDLENSKKYIASLQLPDSRELQIIAHQIWRVRNKYFGHGDIQYNVLSNTNLENAAKVANQVLVVRYLCKRLIDHFSTSKRVLIREIYLFSGHSLGNFVGSISQLENEFKSDFDNRDAKIYDANGAEIEKYTIK